jgi:tetratricopeptide (TPR) repeat protein
MDLAEAEAAAGEFDKASAVLEKSIKRYPRQAQFYYQYALILLYHSSSFDQMASQSKATDLLQRALALDDSVAGAHYELGNIWLNQDEPAKALAQLQRAERLNPSDENTHYALSLALRKLGRPQDAEKERQIFAKVKAEHKNSQP